MHFPKQFMSISELSKIGFSRESLKGWVHVRGFPAFRNKPNGKWYINTDQLEKWLKSKGLMKRNVPNK